MRARRIAFITEGQSEFQSLPFLYEQLSARSNTVLLSPLRINVSPDAPVAHIAKQSKALVKIALARRVDLVVVLFDRERAPSSPGEIAVGLRNAIHEACELQGTCEVVIKDRMYENWLVADVDGLKSHRKRFRVTQAVERQVAPNKADRADALALLKKAAIGSDYDKVADSKRICRTLDVERAAQNSRSFRHLLHVLGDFDYSSQCKVPVKR